MDFAATLQLRATAVYGLTAFDRDGGFHDTLLRKEPGVIDADSDVWVVVPGPPPRIVLQPAQPRFDIEVDGRGVLMATRSSILEPQRNPHVSQAELEQVLSEQLGVVKFIWLDGAPGGSEDITDMHIDGFARFGTPHTIATMSRADLRYWGLPAADIDRLYRASDLAGVPYRFVQLPLTARDVVTSYGYNLGYKGSYVNYYVGNSVVLVPEYKDANDAAAKAILQRLYPERTVVGIDVRNLYRNGGMVHCVTQQQPE